MIPARAPWLPCSHCGWMPVSCTCRRVDDAVWEVLLERSRTKRLSQKHAAEYERMRARWAA